MSLVPTQTGKTFKGDFRREKQQVCRDVPDIYVHMIFSVWVLYIEVLGQVINIATLRVEILLDNILNEFVIAISKSIHMQPYKTSIGNTNTSTYYQ